MATTSSYKEILARRERLAAEERRASVWPLWKCLSKTQILLILTVEFASLSLIAHLARSIH